MLNLTQIWAKASKTQYLLNKVVTRASTSSLSCIQGPRTFVICSAQPPCNSLKIATKFHTLTSPLAPGNVGSFRITRGNLPFYKFYKSSYKFEIWALHFTLLLLISSILNWDLMKTLNDISH